jgi:hypothetical protein
MTAQPRALGRRTEDTRRRLERDVDLWVSTAGPEGGTPYLVPLSFLWDDPSLLIATPFNSPTGRNLESSGRIRVALGSTRDVVLIEGTARAFLAADLEPELLDAFAKKTGFDPRDQPGYRYFRLTPQRIQAWREVNELPGRDLMREGEWLGTDPPRS